MKTALILFFAVLSEVIATTSLKFSEGFTKLVPSVVVVVGYGFAFHDSESDANWYRLRSLVGHWHHVDCYPEQNYLERVVGLGARHRHHIDHHGYSVHQFVFQSHHALITSYQTGRRKLKH